MTSTTTQITFSPSKIEVVKRLLEAKNITFEESLLLMDRTEIGFKELTPPIQPYQPFPNFNWQPPVIYGPGYVPTITKTEHEGEFDMNDSITAIHKITNEEVRNSFQ